MRKSPRYFVDYAGLARQFALGVGLLSLFVLVYTLGSFIGLLHP